MIFWTFSTNVCSILKTSSMPLGDDKEVEGTERLAILIRIGCLLNLPRHPLKRDLVLLVGHVMAQLLIDFFRRHERVVSLPNASFSISSNPFFSFHLVMILMTMTMSLTSFSSENVFSSLVGLISSSHRCSRQSSKKEMRSIFVCEL